MKHLLKYVFVLSVAISSTMYTQAQVSVGISIRIAPPALPVYTQPYCPGDGYLWVPGYWAYSDEGYYWVPGTWILPPEYGLLWTPGYWGFTDGYYGWHEGYWSRHVGYYGGIDYGYGYGGHGYYGGEWRGNTFAYNTAVTNVNTTIVHNTYINKTVINNHSVSNNNRASFNGRGGVTATPTEEEKLASSESHIRPTSSQIAHASSARSNKNQFASVNHGHPQQLVENSVRLNDGGGHPKKSATQRTASINQHQPVKTKADNGPQNIQRSNRETVHNQTGLSTKSQKLPVTNSRTYAQNRQTVVTSSQKRPVNNSSNGVHVRTESPPQRMTAQHPQMTEKRQMQPVKANVGDKERRHEK